METDVERPDDGATRWSSIGAAERVPSTLLELAGDEVDVDREEIYRLLREIVATGLTPRQRLLVELHFTHGLSQGEIASTLGISQQVVSKQLFGTIRSGKRIGGAIRRLRQLCEERGIDPERWV